VPKATILNVDDDENLQMVVGHYLESDGYKVVKAHSGEEMQDRLRTDAADVILLDLVLPDAEGFTLIHKIREKTRAPIIIVSGKSDTTEKVVGLEMGADDYMVKPFEMRELSARIKAALRRAAPAAPTAAETASAEDRAQKIAFNGWVLDRRQYQVYSPTGEPADLTTGEFKLLEALVLSARRALSREHLFELTRDGDYDVFDRAIDIQIARIRKKIGDDPKSPTLIKTVRGVGYMFSGETQAVD
jgi:two-component system OmpR family response regulator